MTILVTCGAGYIGSHTIVELFILIMVLLLLMVALLHPVNQLKCIAWLKSQMLSTHHLILQLLVIMSYLKKSGSCLNLSHEVRVVKYS